MNLDKLIDPGLITDVMMFARVDNSDKLYTAAEAAAACGAQTRQLKPETASVRPCSRSVRQLTREGPLPQSIHRRSRHRQRQFASWFEGIEFSKSGAKVVIVHLDSRRICVPHSNSI